MSERIAAIIPAYQAGTSLDAVVRGTLRHLSDVLVVDDGSSDETSAVARSAGAIVIRHPHNRGKGAALASGFQHWLGLGFEACVTLDADLQHSPEEIPRLLAPELAAADLVLGVRDHLFAGMTPLRRVGNRLSARMISLAAGTTLCDAQTGFRLYRKRLLEGVPWREAGYEAESAVLVRAGRAGFCIASVSIAMGFVDGRTTSHFRPLVDSLRIAGAVLRARFERP